MVDLDISSDVVPASEWHDPVRILPEDHDEVREIQAHVDALSKYRQEMGRLFQALNNLKDHANQIEVDLAEKRRALTAKYNLETFGEGQWAIDFEKKEFVRLSGKAPVIP